MFYPGGSWFDGKEAIREWIWTHFPKNSLILDIGPGCGTYADLLGPENYIFDAVEISEPTLKFLINKYNSIYCMDIRDFPWYQNYDLVIMGDVLEHLTIEDAQKVLNQVLQHCKNVLVAVPFMLPQDGDDNNPFEEHKQADLNFDTMKNRYPQLHLLLYTRNNKYMYDKSTGDPIWTEYVYYIAKGELNE